MKPFSCPECAKGLKSEQAVIDHRRDVHRVFVEPVAKPVDAPVICIECSGEAELVGGERIYPHRPDLYRKRFWLCKCGAYCGCHGVTTRALGNPCGPEARRARMQAHEWFDPLWKSRTMERRAAYDWLARELNIASEDCHISMMTAERAWQVVALCRQRLAA